MWLDILAIVTGIVIDLRITVLPTILLLINNNTQHSEPSTSGRGSPSSIPPEHLPFSALARYPPPSIKSLISELLRGRPQHFISGDVLMRSRHPLGFDPITACRYFLLFCLSYVPGRVLLETFRRALRSRYRPWAHPPTAEKTTTSTKN